jgi:hypothetical protein
VAATPVPDPVVDALRQVAEQRTLSTWERLGDRSDGGEPPAVAYRRVRREMMQAERRILLRLRNRGEVDDEVVRSLQHDRPCRRPPTSWCARTASAWAGSGSTSASA